MSGADGLSVPASEAEVSTEWLSAVVARSDPGLVTEAGPGQRVGEGFGLASRCYRYRLSGAGRQQAVVVKLWHTGTGTGSCEVEFYRDVAPRAGIRLPRCYHGAVDRQSGRGVLVLEDVAAVRQGDVLTRLDLGDSLRLTATIARLHASWWQHPDLTGLGWLRSQRADTRDAGWYDARMPAYLRRFGPPDDPLAARLLVGIEAAVRGTDHLLAGYPPTLTHTDLHLDNVVFGADGEPVVLDWARPAQAPGVLDLADLAFHMSAPGESAAVLTCYLGVLADHGVDVDVPATRRALGAALIRKFSIWTLGCALWVPRTPREPALIERSIARALAAVRTWADRDPEFLAHLR